MRPGERVAIVSPSGPADPARLRRGAARLAALGADVVVGEHALDRAGLPYLAGGDAARAADLQAAWCDPAVTTVFCSRGGYGAARLLDLLDWDAMRAADRKTLVGSSDITALHHVFGLELGVPTLHGPMPACDVLAGEDGPEPATWEHLLAAFTGPPPPIGGTAVLSPGRVKAPVVGGNLSILASMCGTRWPPAFAGKIVFLEDIGEAPYRIDRMLTQLLHSGAFDGVLGVALGSWEGCGDPLPVLQDRLLPLGVPVLAGLAVGHGSPQLSLWLGALGAIDTESCSLAGRFHGAHAAR
ncbi:LD-carboxypeptidase [Nonomuraea longicatena]|uniref:LD-carboxypeptidase n=1 Tax=Nonomuraea longicatena TaxID=83682 RepID=A0ABN1NZD4_9ACTN